MRRKHIEPHLGKTVRDLMRQRLCPTENPISARPMQKEKRIQDLFKGIIDEYKEPDEKNQIMSGTGGEIIELYCLLGDMLQAQNDSEASKKRSSMEKEKQEKQKFLEGHEIVLN